MKKEEGVRSPQQVQWDQALATYLASGQSFPMKTPLTIGDTLVCYVNLERCPDVGEVIDAPFYDAMVVDANQERVLTRELAHTTIRCRIENVTGMENGYVEGVPVRSHLNVLMVPVNREEHKKYFAMVQHLSALSSARKPKILLEQLPFTDVPVSRVVDAEVLDI